MRNIDSSRKTLPNMPDLSASVMLGRAFSTLRIKFCGKKPLLPPLYTNLIILIDKLPLYFSSYLKKSFYL
ncbi:hypothetical protein C4J81_18995 (plasmid) [Deltaproteobacteria bacterium Smac51]|nr:hypothetical protein C4J81_18995 [Deltaproteobacteria bacterium Smac51]